MQYYGMKYHDILFRVSIFFYIILWKQNVLKTVSVKIFTCGHISCTLLHQPSPKNIQVRHSWQHKTLLNLNLITAKRKNFCKPCCENQYCSQSWCIPLMIINYQLKGLINSAEILLSEKNYTLLSQDIEHQISENNMDEWGVFAGYNSIWFSFFGPDCTSMVTRLKNDSCKALNLSICKIFYSF